MSNAKIWKQIEKNCQRVAEEQELVLPGDPFTLTDGQKTAIAEVNGKLDDGDTRMLLKAPTGAGKTEVFLRVSITRAVQEDKPVVLIIPTRDLARQQAQYFEDRIKDTGLGVAQLHGGIPPRKRKKYIDDIDEGQVHFLVGSAILLQHRKYRPLLEKAGLIVVDDVNAFDEDEDLIHLRGLKTPVLFTTATPDAVAKFLKQEKAYSNRIEMTQMPFASPPTTVHNVQASWNENIFSQIDMGMDVLKRHIEDGSRIFIISRTRARVPVVGQYVQDRLGVPVSILHGDMADSSEHRKRMRRGRKGSPTEDRVTMMKQFRDNKPAILVATNLVGSGLDVPMADMVLVTDSDHFGEAEIEQLMGRVGRRERPSDAVLIKGTTGSPLGRDIKIKTFSRVRNGRVVHTYQAVPQGRRKRIPRRLV